MGRAYEVRKASILKTGAAKGKLYSTYAKEIYQAAKNGGTDSDTNAALKRLIDRAKKEQIPADIIKRAIDKVNSGADESYTKNNYELIGPAGSTLIVECLTDNVNRTVSDLRTVINKCHIKMGGPGSVSFNYDHLCIVAFKGLSLDDTLNALIDNGVDIIDVEEENGIVIYGNPTELFRIKEAITKIIPAVEFDMDEIAYLAKEKVILNGDDKVIFDKVLTMLDDVEDVSSVHHNVEV